MYGSIVNRVMERAGQPVPEVGMPATSTYWSDRYAGVITWVSRSGKTLRFREDGRGEAEFTFSLRANGRWVARGESARSGTGLLIGRSDPYRDPEF